MDAIRDKHNFVELEAHGLAVGLKEGLMGNSEVGHLNIGAGRIVWQDIVKIDQCEFISLTVLTRIQASRRTSSASKSTLSSR